MEKHLPSNDLEPVDPDVRRLARRRFRAEVDAVPGDRGQEIQFRAASCEPVGCGASGWWDDAPVFATAINRLVALCDCQ
jgi:hypothetical protein